MSLKKSFHFSLSVYVHAQGVPPLGVSGQREFAIRWIPIRRSLLFVILIGSKEPYFSHCNQVKSIPQAVKGEEGRGIPFL